MLTSRLIRKLERLPDKVHDYFEAQADQLLAMYAVTGTPRDEPTTDTKITRFLAHLDDEVNAFRETVTNDTKKPEKGRP